MTGNGALPQCQGILVFFFLAGCCLLRSGADALDLTSEDNWVYTDRDMLSRAVSRETALLSGSVRFRFAVGSAQTVAMLAGADEDEMLPDEAKRCAFIDYTWSDPDMWRVRAVGGDGGVVREVVCDGEWIDTGDGVVWDATFLCHWSDARDGDFRRAIWPYRVACDGYVFPLSLKRRRHMDITSMPWLIQRYREPVPAGESNAWMFGAFLPLDSGAPPLLWQTFLLSTEQVPRLLCRRIFCKPPLVFEYGSPAMLASGAYVPSHCRLLLREDGSAAAVAWEATLMPEESRLNCGFDPEIFCVDVDGASRVEMEARGWPKPQRGKENVGDRIADAAENAWNGSPLSRVDTIAWSVLGLVCFSAGCLLLAYIRHAADTK